MKKVSFRDMSEKTCVKCGRPLKQNLILKKPRASHCYKCWKKAR